MMRFNEVPAKNGYLWVEKGFQIFWENLTIFLIGSFCYSLLIMPISAMPVFRYLLPQFVGPLISICFMTICRNTLNKEPTSPSALLLSIRTTFSKGTLWQLLLIGAYNVLALCIIFALSALIDSGLLIRLMFFPQSVRPEMIEDSHWILSILVMAILFVPVSMLFWFAPFLIAWNKIPLHKALFFSVVACWRNFSALIVYLLVVFFICALLSTVWSSLFSSWSAEPALQKWMLTAVGTISMPLFICINYISYVNCFSYQSKLPTAR